MTYECHITLSNGSSFDSQVASRIAELREWKTSEIARDPIMGDSTFLYLTKHDAHLNPLFREMEETCELLRRVGIEVLRQKIEHIVYDTKTGVDIYKPGNSPPP